MMRLPYFAFHAPTTVREAADLIAASPEDSMLVAGGTDLLPNMKRRQQVPRTLVGLRHVADLRGISNAPARNARGALGESSASDSESKGLTIGAGVTLSELVKDDRVRATFAG